MIDVIERHAVTLAGLGALAVLVAWGWVAWLVVCAIVGVACFGAYVMGYERGYDARGVHERERWHR